MLTPLPTKRYTEEPFTVTVYATWTPGNGKLVRDAPEPENVVAVVHQ